MVRFRLFVHSFIKSLEKWCSHAFNAFDQSGSHDFLNNVMANSLCSIMLVVLLFCCSEIRINLHGFTMNAIVVDSHFNTCIRSDFIYKVSWLLVNSIASTFCIYSLHFCVHWTYLNDNSTLFYRVRKVNWYALTSWRRDFILMVWIWNIRMCINIQVSKLLEHSQTLCGNFSIRINSSNWDGLHENTFSGND